MLNHMKTAQIMWNMQIVREWLTLTLPTKSEKKKLI